MKTIYDNNFLNGTLSLIVDEDRKVVTGKYRFYDEVMDDFFTFHARSKCHKSDNFSENKGIELVKSKLARDYHKMYLNQWSMLERELEAHLRYIKEQKEFRKRKVVNIEKDLTEHFGLTYWRRENKKPARKTKTKKK
jgi:hypothetical protein